MWVAQGQAADSRAGSTSSPQCLGPRPRHPDDHPGLIQKSSLQRRQTPGPVPNPQPLGTSQRSRSLPSASWGRGLHKCSRSWPLFQSTYHRPFSAACRPSPGLLTTTRGCSFTALMLKMRRLRPREIKHRFSGVTSPNSCEVRMTFQLYTKKPKQKSTEPCALINGRAGI